MTLPKTVRCALVSLCVVVPPGGKRREYVPLYHLFLRMSSSFLVGEPLHVTRIYLREVVNQSLDRHRGERGDAFHCPLHGRVLYPAPVRDSLFRTAKTDVCRARWMDRIHHEWSRPHLEERPKLDAPTAGYCALQTQRKAPLPARPRSTVCHSSPKAVRNCRLACVRWPWSYRRLSGNHFGQERILL